MAAVTPAPHSDLTHTNLRKCYCRHAVLRVFRDFRSSCEKADTRTNMGNKGKAKKPKAVDVDDDPVKNFEKWKKRYDKTKQRVKRDKQQSVSKRDWEVERERIDALVKKYPTINPKEAVKFSDFPLSKNTIRGLLGAQYRQPTEIQRQTLAFALQGRDVLGAAKTGSGKTLAFLIPVLECLYRQQWTAMDGLGALIISPTRELAYQTFEVLRRVGRNHEFSAGLVIGGKDLKEESNKIHRTNIIICTPGRLLQHMDQTAAFHTSSLHMLVLDEADRILDMGFADTLNAIVENLPRSRQTLLFSATQTKSVRDLARLSLKDPEYVWVHEQARYSTPATLEQSYMVCELHQKVNLLYSFLRSHLQKKTIVFFACCKEVQYLFRVFCRLRPGIPVLALHGKQQQMKRVDVYNDFVRKNAAVLFATDLAARGLDFPAVNWVLQFDCPEDANTYIHRVGRTARYREGGEALLLLLPSEEEAMLQQLQDKKVPVSKIQVNPEKLQCVQQKLEAFLAQEAEQKERAQRCFVSYVRSVYLMKNKDVFNVFKLPLPQYATSLGLAVAPRVRFLGKVQQRPAPISTADQSEEEKEGEEVDLQTFRTHYSSSEEEEEEGQGDTPPPATLLCGYDDDDDEDLKDLLTIKRRDVFHVSEENQDEQVEPQAENTHRKKKDESKFKEAKKAMKRKFKVNTKKLFTEDGEEIQQWPSVQWRALAEPEEEEEEEQVGINIEEARARLRREDQEFDKGEYTRRIRQKHRERRLKEKAARREASKQNKEKEESEDEEEEGDVEAYLSGADEEFDPSTLPDPDAICNDDGEEENDGDDDDASLHRSDTAQRDQRKRPHHHSSSVADADDEDGGRKRRRSGSPLDTGLSLAEDEQLVLHLLGQS